MSADAAVAVGDRTLRARLIVRRGDFTLDVAFEVPPGVTLLHGPSGAGKSTALAAIAGLVRPGGGRVTLGAQPWFDAASGIDVPVEERGVAIVFQRLALFPHMSALANVEYAVSRSLDAAARRQRAEE